MEVLVGLFMRRGGAGAVQGRRGLGIPPQPRRSDHEGYRMRRLLMHSNCQ